MIALIPVYNNGDTLEKCIRSIYDGIEKIYVVDGRFTGAWSEYLGKDVEDDFSTDNTYEICKRYDKIVYSRCIGTPGDKLNSVLDMLPDECYILQIDADEVMMDNGIKRLEEFLQTEKGKKYGNFSIYVYHLFGDCEHYIDMSKVLSDIEMRFEFVYFLRLHYYRRGFKFYRGSSELLMDNGNVYNPCYTHEQGREYSYCIPESVCSLVDLRFLRKNAYQKNRLVDQKVDDGTMFVKIKYGRFEEWFPVKEFEKKYEYSVLE